LNTKVNNDSELLNAPTHYVGIGASAGGLEAIETFFTNLRPDSNMAFIVIQHLSPDYKSLMVELLSKKTLMDVHRAEDGMRIKPNNVYLIPPKKNLTVYHGKLLLSDQISRGINLPIDIFLKSLAEDQGEKAIAIILSGTGSDGTRGVRAIKEHGGAVMVQDEASAKFDGMPRAAMSTGLADFILPPQDMPEQLIGFTEHPYVSNGTKSTALISQEDGLTHIFSMLREKTKVDFTYYKPSTIIRRIERRVSVNQMSDLEEYVEYLRKYPGEIMSLYRELLIGVTSFFRDDDAFHNLREKWLPELIKKSNSQEHRFWVAGCSTGEEAYSLAILTREIMEDLGVNHDIKIFATDIDRDAILTAGNGIYPESIAADLKPKLLAKYFYRKEENYQVARNIREMVVFAQHNLIKDPPFTNIDLVSCRNLLIYLQPVLQQKALEMFNFSLKQDGILFLGSSETIGDMTAYFEPINHRFKLYKSKGKRGLPETREFGYSMKESLRRQGEVVYSGTRTRSNLAEDRLLHRFLNTLSDKFVPLTVIVNDSMNVVHTLGDSEGFFKLPSGRVDFNISKMVSKELSIPLLNGIQKVFRTKKELTYANIQLRNYEENQSLKMNIVPLPDKKGQEPLVAVFLEKVEKEIISEKEKTFDSYDITAEADQRIRDLETELQFTKENLQATIEELETSNEELQATNEELLASNEELQSTNEELQSTNEELHTVNSEYQNKIIELTELHNDVDNLLTSSSIGKLLLDENLEIRKYSPEITKIFRIMEQDIGRPLSHLTNKLIGFDPVEAAKKVIKTGKIYEKDVKSENGEWFLARALPYSIGPETFSGIVLTFIDITDLKKSESNLKKSLQLTEDIINFMPSGLFIYGYTEDKKLRLEIANKAAEELTGIDVKKSIGMEFDEIWPTAKETGLTDRYIQVVETGESLRDDNVFYQDDKLEGIFEVVAFKIPENRLAISFENVTEKRQTEQELIDAEEKFRSLFEYMAPGVVYQNDKGEITSANPSAEVILGLTLDQMQGRTSMDPRWKAMDRDKKELPGDKHPAMVALKTGERVENFIMGVFNPANESTSWIMVNSHPVKDENGKVTQVFSTFENISSLIGK
jgi:two-component system CheB/CheR fusion protein